MNDSIPTGKLVPYLAEMFRYQAWVALGKVVNPVTQKLDRDLGAAKQIIDLVGELERRTEGNRSADETRILQGVLTELRLNYLDEMKKPEPPAAGAEPSAADEEPS